MLRFLLYLTLFVPLLSQALELKQGDYSGRADVEEFIQQVAADTAYSEQELLELFSLVKHQRHLFERMDKPAEKLHWHQYRRIFLTDKRITAGVKFWQENRDLLQQVEAKFEVPAEIIVAIVGVETFYGIYKGKSPVFDTLVTFAFDYPKRAKFFTRELREFLILARENDLDTRGIKGSYAGAMGVPQFISSSYRHYAVDFDGDGKANLFDSLPDILASVANYFKVHGWRSGQPVTYPIRAAKQTPGETIKPSMKPEQRWKDLKSAGFSSQAQLDDETMVALLRFQQKNSPEHWAGLENFYGITRNTHTPLYAMAEYQLIHKIKRQVG